jgi:hypothetical protein
MKTLKNVFLGFVAALVTMTICATLKLPDFFTGWVSCMTYFGTFQYFEKND